MANRPERDQHLRGMVDAHWARGPLALDEDPAERRRIATIAALAALCPEAKSALDVGCGDGTVLRALARIRRPRLHLRVGCDPSRPGLRHLDEDARPVRGSSAALPFADRSFDLVLCCDVLEHLPDETAAATVAELRRVTRRYLLLNVPFAEDLGWSMLSCERCGLDYHRDHHVRRYAAEDLIALAASNGFSIQALRTTGATVRRIVPLPLRVGAGLQLGHDAATSCPACGAIPDPLHRSRAVARAAFFRLHSALTWPLRRSLSRDTELVALLARERE